MKILNQVTDSLVNNTNQQPVASARSPRAALGAPRPISESQSQLPEKINASRLQRWSDLGGMQLKFSQFKSAEGSLGCIYRELVNVNMMLDRKVHNPEKMATRIRQLDSQVSSTLTAKLQPKVMKAETDRPDYVLKSVNLLAKKPAETMSMVLPSAGKSVSFHIPAYAEPGQIVDSINKSLAPIDIKVSTNREQNLVFSPNQSQRRALDEPVLFSGEGIRVPAGNPVPVQMVLQGGALAVLADTIESNYNKTSDNKEVSDQVRQVQTDIRHTIVQLRYYMDQIRNKPSSQSESIDISSVESDLSRLLRDGDFGSRLTSLLAQANISRDTAVSLLNK